MTTVGSYEAKTHLPALLKRVKKGEKIVITLRGVPAALLTQPPSVRSSKVQDVVEDMLAYSKRRKRTLGKITIRQMIEEGRRF